MSAEKLYHFSQIASKKSEQIDETGQKQLTFICDELNTDLLVFLWVNRENDPTHFQFFFFEKVIDWSMESGCTTNQTNRFENPQIDAKIGYQKGIRTLTRVDDPSMVEEALQILDKSVFPLGIKDFLKLRIENT